ncbi:MAG TPA: hypothetical protein VN456_10805 [Desulfosporosinus sp.]|nr:hypothetical protein [Desulfosporosinus sp.]
MGILMLRQYILLATASLDFASVILGSIEEEEDGTLTVNPVVLAGVSMDHISLVGGLVRWIRG